MISEESKIIYTKACGKVLVAGGYGVLEQSNIGLTLALENYFYCRLQKVTSQKKTLIIVESPQINKTYQYAFDIDTKKLKQASSQQNIFVQNAIFYALQYFKLLQASGHLRIVLTFDKGFISQTQHQQNDQKFIIYQENYSKTGLGSSACVVVSIVSAICALMDHKQNKKLINVISQVANLSAQKKIGSNFDISTAVFSTHLYKNVIPHKAFNSLHDQNWTSLIELNPEILQLTQVKTLIKDHSKAFMIDVSRGANTRVMVSNFLKNLRAQSQQIQENFFKQSKQLTQKLYNIFCSQNSDKRQTLNLMREVNWAHRKLQQKYSKTTNTPVQPEEFEGFLNQLMEDENVLYVICPGSGGFDALFMLVSKENNDTYYQQLIERAKQSHEKQLGQGVDFKLKQVNIKWQCSMEVTNQQINQIEHFLKDKAWLKNSK